MYEKASGKTHRAAEQIPVCFVLGYTFVVRALDQFSKVSDIG